MFLSAVAGNYASYVSYRRTHAAAPAGIDVPAWYYDIDKARARGPRTVHLGLTHGRWRHRVSCS